MYRAFHFIPAGLVAAWLFGCASSDAPIEIAPGAETVEEAPERVIDPAFIAGPSVEWAWRGPIEGGAEVVIETDASEGASASFWRADGRPAWWLAEPRREGGRVTVTAEAIGADLGEARARAIDAGRAALEKSVGPAPGGERVDSLLIRRLEGDAPGRARYVGYARLSAREPEPVSP